MNRLLRFATIAAGFGAVLMANAQDVAPLVPAKVDSVRPVQVVTAVNQAGVNMVVKPRYGSLSYDSLFHSMPEYVKAMESLERLRQQYYKETEYNSANFKRLFMEFLQGQKEFPQNILLKRQRDLQSEMERDLAFRHQADSLLTAAQKELLLPVAAKLDSAIRLVGAERGYDFVINTDVKSHPYVNAALTEDATPYVREKLLTLETWP